jgi:hypothetical protein
MRLLVTTRDERWQRDVAQAATRVNYGMSFNHLIGAGKKRRRHVKPERLRGLQVNDKLELGGLQYRKVSGLGTGRLRLATSPICTGSPMVVKTMGVVMVAAFAATAAGVVNAAITITWR